ncbi:MAG: MotA/TolQ/ExbB proton channel family protein [Planctomycetaceae bacterium]|nr:MotA/TolQ/ExbB proton channel family protein [Planctomycetaceae bacterium]
MSPNLQSTGIRTSEKGAESQHGTRTLRNRREQSLFGVVIPGAFLTVIFYAVAPVMPGAREFVTRYFCSHPLEYVSTFLFCIGCSILWSGFRRSQKERRGLEFVEEQQARIRECKSAEEWLHPMEPVIRTTFAAARVGDAIQYCNRNAGASLEEHLRYLAELASERLHQSYAMMRTITWAIPILGFLGTVIGITIAIANVTPEQLESSLPEVTAGLAVAFDTTAQALGMSIVLVFSTFVVERREQALLSEVEQFGIDTLFASLVPSPEQSSQAGSDEVLHQTRLLLRKQEAAWTTHLEELQSKWSQTLLEGTARISESLGRETDLVLESHRHAMSEAGDSYSAVLHRSTKAFADQMQGSLAQFSDRIESWQSALQQTSLSACGQAEELHSLGRTLLQLTESEQRLAALQQQLNQNLQAMQIVETLEQTVSSLNAAIHVLTAKSNIRSAA